MADLAIADDHAITLAPAAQAVLVVSNRRRCVEANEFACELLGMTRDEIVGRKLDTLLVTGMGPRLSHVWTAFAEAGGHAGPFTLTSGTEVQISLTPNLMDDRHLLVLAQIGAAPAQAAPEEHPAQAVPEPAGRPPSARELEVLKLLAQGATDPQIAQQLGLSPATVQTHVRNAKAKLGARTRAQAVAMVLGRGLIDF